MNVDLIAGKLLGYRRMSVPPDLFGGLLRLSWLQNKYWF